MEKNVHCGLKEGIWKVKNLLCFLDVPLPMCIFS